jgi:hypothetical protein
MDLYFLLYHRLAVFAPTPNSDVNSVDKRWVLSTISWRRKLQELVPYVDARTLECTEPWLGLKSVQRAHTPSPGELLHFGCREED